MLKWTARAVIPFVLGIATLGVAQAQEPAGGRRALTAPDYAEIQQLYARYAFAYDTAEDNGNAYARVFTPDGAFNFPNGDPRARCPVIAGSRAAECKGHEALAKLARGSGNKSRLTLSHVTMNIVIEPTPEGATGKAYLGLPSPGGGGLRVAGLYEDVLVKTPQGWRFKLRAYTSILNLQREASPPPTR